VRYVVDCSVAVKWFIEEAHSSKALHLLDRYQRAEVTLLAPDCIIAELGHTLRKLAVGGDLTAEDARAAVADFISLPLELVGSRGLATSAMKLALENMATFYDALYIALADREDVTVVTADDRMVRAFARINRAVLLSNLG
jgi:predicted nucleic acid-binding protein